MRTREVASSTDTNGGVEDTVTPATCQGLQAALTGAVTLTHVALR